MKPIRSVATFAIAGLVATFAIAGLTGALGVAAVAAVHTVATAPIHASAGSAVRPSHANEPAVDITCRFHSNRFTTYYGNCTSWIDWSCSQGNEHSISRPDFVSNDCAHDVVLFSNSNETGSQLCIAPFSKTHHLGNPWRSFRVRTGFSC
jgi:hypothetical protein